MPLSLYLYIYVCVYTERVFEWDWNMVYNLYLALKFTMS